jgi:putative transposase
LNMVRAGVVDHPIKWVNSGYHEIQQPPKRYRVIDLPGLFGLCRLFETSGLSANSSPMG